MSKTFVLAAVGLTAVLGLGGGVMNLIELEQVTPSQLFRLMLIVLPVAGSLTLPIAALYSATTTYGRMAADNEFVACRASGIDILRLLMPPLLLSLLVAACTFYFTSFLIPGLVKDMNRIAREDLRQFVIQELESPKRLGFSGLPVRIYADHAAPSRDDSTAIILSGVAFLEVGEDGYDRFGTAESIIIRFSQLKHGRIAISGKFVNATVFDARRGAWGDAGDQTFGPEVLPEQINAKLKWLNLPELFRLRKNPENWPKVAEALDATRTAIFSDAYCASVMRDFHDDSRLILVDGVTTIDLTANDATSNPGDNNVEFRDVSITERRDGLTRTITGATATLSISQSPTGDTADVILQVIGDVTVTNESGATLRKGREQLAILAANRSRLGESASFSNAQLLDPDVPISLGDTAAGARDRAIHEVGKLIRRLGSELHSRLAFSMSVLVLVVLGAVLGITFRGSRVLVAFGISFVPALFVIVMNIMGRQLAEKDGTVLIGMIAIWGSITAVAALDAWTMTMVLRR